MLSSIERFGVGALALSVAVLAAAAPPCAAAPQRPISWRAVAAKGLPPPKVGPPAPTFQVIGLLGDQAVVNPTALLTPAVFLQPDSGFNSVFLLTGLAVSNSGRTFVVANDDSGNSALGQVNFTTGAETTIGQIPGYVINDIAFDNAGHLYGLTDNSKGASPHSLLLINTATAAASVAKVLDNHGGANNFSEFGAIAFNPADGSFYYADRDGTDSHTFLDRLAPGTFAQTPVFSTGQFTVPTAMAFSQGSLWLFSGTNVYTASASNLAAGLTAAGTPEFPTADGTFSFYSDGAVPNTLSCVPSPTAACLYNRFKVEITYDATPTFGTGPASVVLESTASVKFTFFDPTNIEMVLKVLDACSFNNKWWVYAGGLTDVGVSVKVTDTQTGALRTYNSAKGHLFQTFADSSAFACP